jgi:hypothetical protein
MCASSAKEMDSEQCNLNKNTCEKPNHSKSGKIQKKVRASSKRNKKRRSRVSKSSKHQSDTDLVETFETSVTETDGFPVISIKSVLKSPKDTTQAADRVSTAVPDSACQQVSYRSFIGGVSGGECSTPVTGRAESPHTSHSVATNSGLFSEMLDFVSSLEKNLTNGNSSTDKVRFYSAGKFIQNFGYDGYEFPYITGILWDMEFV